METIGGFRLVRLLGSGTRAEVHLGHPVTGDEVSSSRAAAVKVFRPTTTGTSIDDEIDALARLSSPFLLALRDLAIAEDGRPVLILARLGPMTCSRLILERQRIGAGEAVTILAPLTDAVDELDRVGVVHGRIRLDRIGFDDVGTPVLLGFGHARVTAPVPGEDGCAIEPPGSPSGEKADDDTTGLAAVARSVIEAVRPDPRTAELLDWITASYDDAAVFRSELRNRLFDLADPEPVVLAAARRTSGVPASMTRVDPVRDDELPSRGPDWFAAMHLPDWLGDLLVGGGDGAGRQRIGEGGRRAFSAAHRSLASVRRPVWVVAASVAALLVTALVVTGSGNGDRARADPADRPVTPSPIDGRVAEPDPGGDDDSTEEPSGVADADDRMAAIMGDDPAVAATALLRARADCIAARSVLCLDGVDQHGSAALEADSTLVRAMQEGEVDEPLDLTGRTPAVTESLGGTVILSLGPPSSAVTDPVTASLLILRGEGGWRIRDLIVG